MCEGTFEPSHPTINNPEIQEVRLGKNQLTLDALPLANHHKCMPNVKAKYYLHLIIYYN